MPDDILAIVEAGMEVAKTAPKMRDNVEAKEIPAAVTPEQIAANKARYDNTQNDIAEALKPGERYLTEAEAKARREKLMQQRKEQGLNVFE